jgi:hypothetical protein
VWVEEDYSRSSDESRTYAFCVQFRERGGGVEWGYWSRYKVTLPTGKGSYRFKGVHVHTVDDALSIIGEPLREVLLNIKADVDHLLTFYGAVGAT